MPPEQRRSFDPVMRSLHWVMALLIISLWCVGIVMEDLPKGPLRGEVFGLHKAFGVVVLGLALVRLGWRVTHTVPPLPANMSALEKAAATWAHRLLYVLMLAMPVSGILMSQTHGRSVSLFGQLTLPTLLGEDEFLSEIFEALHGGLAMALAALVVIHVAAALQHHFIRKDDVLMRMLTGKSNGPESS